MLVYYTFIMLNKISADMNVWERFISADCKPAGLQYLLVYLV